MCVHDHEGLHRGVQALIGGYWLAHVGDSGSLMEITLPRDERYRVTQASLTWINGRRRATLPFCH
jgi:hypothetical protein